MEGDEPKYSGAYEAADKLDQPNEVDNNIYCEGCGEAFASGGVFIRLAFYLLGQRLCGDCKNQD